MKKYIILAIILLTMLLMKLYLKNTFISETFCETDKDNLLMNNKNQIEPYNYFIDIRNPINSCKVLVQTAVEKFNDDFKDSYYKITQNVEPNRDYKISSWYSLSEDWDGKDNLFNIDINGKKLSSNGKINKELNVDGLKWYHTDFVFKPTSKIIDIFLGYKPKNTKGKRYIADLKLNPHIAELNDFPSSDKLILFLDANTPKSYNNYGSYKRYWMNMMNDKNIFKWEKEPDWNKKGYFSLKDRKCTGPTPHELKLNNEEFSIVLVCSSMGGDGNGEIINIPGNQNTAFAINMPNSYGSIICDIVDKKYTIDNQILVENTNVYVFSYKNNKMDVYVNDILVQTIENIDNVYFNKNPIIINKYRDCQIKLYSLLIYNKKLESSDVKFINRYFHKNLLNNSPNIEEIENYENYQFNETSIEDNDFLSENNNIKCPKITEKNGEYELEVSNTEWAKSSGVNIMKYKSKDECLNDYNKFYPECETNSLFDKEMDKINKCIFTGKHTDDPNEHPCQKCPELDNYDYKTDISLSQDCKHAINSYCYNQLSKGKKMDFKNCKCFLPDFAFTKECQNPMLELHDRQINYDSLN